MTILYNATSTIQNVTDTGSFSITGGSLTVTSAASQISTSLTVASGASLTASGSGTTFVASAAATLDGANLYASGGAVLTLTGATTYTASPGSTIQASGKGSEIDLSKVTTLTGSTSNTLYVTATSGGEVNMSEVNSNPVGRVFFSSTGSGSVLDLSSLATINGDPNDYTSSLTDSTGGTVLDPLLTSLIHTDLDLDGSGAIATRQITSFTSASLNLSGGKPDLSNLATITDGNLYASGGATLALPALTGFTSTGSTTIQASGAGSVVDLTSQTKLVGAPTYYALSINAESGGEVNLSKVTSQPTGRVVLYSYGAGSVIDISALPEVLSDTSYNSSLEAGNGGKILDGSLTTLSRADYHLDDSMSSLDASHIAAMASSNVYVAGGADLAFPALTASSWSYGGGITIQASGKGTVLDLTNLTTLSGAPTYYALSINAESGGEVNLSKVTSQPTGRVLLYSYGTGSVIDISALPEVMSDTYYNSSLEAGGGGAILDGALTTLNHADYHLDDGASSLDASHITTIASANLYVGGGADLTFPSLTSWTYPQGSTVQASGQGTVFDLSSLTTLAGATTYYTLAINAESGGEINLSKVTSQPTGRVAFYSYGTGSVIDISALPEVLSDTSYNSSLEAGGGGKILDGSLTTLHDADYRLDDSSSSLDASHITTIVSSGIYAAGGADVAFPALTSYAYPTGATIEASGAGTVLDLTNFTTLDERPTYYDLSVYAEYGGEVNLSKVTSQPTGRVQFYAYSAGSVIDISALPEVLSDTSYNSSLEAGGGAKILDGSLTTLSHADYRLDDSTSSIDATHLSTITSSNIYVAGARTLPSRLSPRSPIRRA